MGREYKDIYYQQRLVPLEILYEEKHLNRLFDADDINSQYVQSVFAEEFEKQMFEATLQKRIMNGSVVALIDKPRHDRIIEKTNSLQQVFYFGDRLTSLEQDIERMYISSKMEKYSLYKKRKSIRYKVKWTISDLNRF